MKRGYADFRVVSAVAELSPDSKSFVLTYVLDEGKRYKVRNQEIFSEIDDVNPDEFMEYLELDDGDWYNNEKVEKTVTALTDELGKKGLRLLMLYPNWLSTLKVVM